MARWVASVPLAAVIVILAVVVPVSATEGPEDLKITINPDYKLVAGENFQIDFTVYKPPDLGPLNGPIYMGAFYIDGASEIHYCAEPYQEVPGGSDNYVENKTEYTLNGILTPDAPVGPYKYINILVHWRISLDNDYSPASPAYGDNLTVTINDNEYYAMVVAVHEVEGTTRYYIADYPDWNVYVRENEPNYLYVNAIDSYKTAELPPAPLDNGEYRELFNWWVIVLIIAAVAAVMGLILIKRRQGSKRIKRR